MTATPCPSSGPGASAAASGAPTTRQTDWSNGGGAPGDRCRAGRLTWAAATRQPAPVSRQTWLQPGRGAVGRARHDQHMVGGEHPHVQPGNHAGRDSRPRRAEPADRRVPDEHGPAVAAQRVRAGQEQLVQGPVVREQGGIVTPERLDDPRRHGRRAVDVGHRLSLPSLTIHPGAGMFQAGFPK